MSGNPAKIIKGTEIDDEFNAIAVAVQTKADLVSPTFTGTPLAPTAVAGTNTTQIATTSFVTAADTAAITAERTATATLTNKTLTSPTINGGTITGITDLTVADGGTGRSSLTAENVLLGDGTNAVKFVAPSTSGNVLSSNGTTWSSTALSALSVFDKSLSANGYQKLPGGLIIQWGTVSTLANGKVTVNFPISFPTSTLSVQVTTIGNDTTNSSGDVGAAKVNTVTTSSFSLVTADDVNQDAYWLAIGY